MFIVGNLDGTGSELDEVWVNYTDSTRVRIVDGDHLLLFEGSLYRDCGKTLNDVVQAFRTPTRLSDFVNFKGCYGGVYVNLVSGDVTAFCDHLGLGDVYVWQNGNKLLASNCFGSLLARLPLKYRLLDTVATVDFRVLGFILGNRTFAKSVTHLRPGALQTIRKGNCKTEVYWQYRLSPRPMDIHEAIDDLHAHLEVSTNRILAIAGDSSRFLVGLSGGLDSRVTAFYFSRAAAEISAYFFGEFNSDAGRVAKSVAKCLRLPIHFVGRNREFPLFFQTSLNYDPSANLEWCKYMTGRGDILDFDILLSGNLGDHAVGEWSFSTLAGSSSQEVSANEIFYRCRLQLTSRDEQAGIVGRIQDVLSELDRSVAEQKQAFWYYNIGRYNRHAGLFHDFGRRPHYSLFEDIDLFEFCSTIPAVWHMRNRFYESFIARHIPHMSLSNIRRDDGLNTHKPIESWLTGNAVFKEETSRLIRDSQSRIQISDQMRDWEEVIESILRGSLSRNEIHQFFRHLTIEAFQMKYLLGRSALRLSGFHEFHTKLGFV